jgi:outer membrane receptor protein involved in Fe transport
VYSFVDATYRSDFEVVGESNSSADDEGNIEVSRGNRIPLIARHTGRFRLDYSLTDKWDIGGSVIYSSGVYLHGNENNANVPDGDEFIGSGKIGGYGIVNVQSTWHVGKIVDAFVKLDNVLNRKYATAGFLTSNALESDGSLRPDPDDWTNENLVSPGQPFAVFAGVRVSLR